MFMILVDFEVPGSNIWIRVDQDVKSCCKLVNLARVKYNNNIILGGRKCNNQNYFSFDIKTISLIIILHFLPSNNVLLLFYPLLHCLLANKKVYIKGEYEKDQEKSTQYKLMHCSSISVFLEITFLPGFVWIRKSSVDLRL